MPQLEGVFRTYLIEQRERIKIVRCAFWLKDAIREIQQGISHREIMLNEDIEVLQERWREAQEPLRRIQEQREQAVRHVTRVHRQVELRVADMAHGFYSSLADEVADWIDNYEVARPLKPTELRNSDAREAAFRRVCNEIVSFANGKIQEGTTEWL